MVRLALHTGLLLLLQCVAGTTAALQLTQGRLSFADNSHVTFTVEGVATVELGGSSQPIYYFDCSSTTNNGSGLVWTREGVARRFDFSYDASNNASRLNAADIGHSDLGVYSCIDTLDPDNSMVSINITSANPAVCAVEEVVGVVEGQTVQLEIYASSYPLLGSGQLTWYRPNGSAISGEDADIFDQGKRLVFSDIRAEDAGLYRCEAAVLFFENLYFRASDSIQLNVYSANHALTGLMAVQDGLTSIQVSWTAPASGGANLTGYHISYQTDGGSVQSVDVGAGATSLPLTVLQSGATYSISIEARFSELPSARVGPETVTLKPFEAPIVMTSVLGPTSTRVTFTQPSGTLAAESYDIQYTRVTGAGQTLCGSVQDTGAATDVQSPFTITNLEEFSSYDFTVTAQVFSTMRPTTEQATTSPAAPAAAPRDLVSTTVLSTSITVGWNTVECIERNGVIDNYIVRFGPEGGVQSESTVQSGGIDVNGTYNASGLTPFTNYSFEVAAMTSGDTGPFTATLFVETEEDVPGPVDATSNFNTLSITITWSEPQAPNGVITHYEVQYSPQSDPADITTANNSLSRTFTLSNLEPGETFTFIVTPFTRIGPGRGQTVTASARPCESEAPTPPVQILSCSGGIAVAVVGSSLATALLYTAILLPVILCWNRKKQLKYPVSSAIEPPATEYDDVIVSTFKLHPKLPETPGPIELEPNAAYGGVAVRTTAQAQDEEHLYEL